MAEKRPALGKGLSALIPDVPEPRTSALEVDVDRLEPNRFQPRTNVDAAGIEDLARSIKANGIIQPIVVRRVDGGYQIIAGERRWRAAQHAGLLKVPVVVKDVEEGDEDRLLEMALVENLQRKDLNPIEEALAYRRLMDEFSLTQEQIADAVGKDRSSVANLMRLLRLPPAVRDQVSAGTLAMGHARALLALEQEAAIGSAAAAVVDRGLSVRETEALVKRLLAAPPAPRPVKVPDVHTRAAEQDLRLALGTPVRIVRRRKGGTIEVHFTSEPELQRLYEALTGK
ncbi:MAG TPA: ParB/RepB/Spo0J family partition protein [Vicinamibacterales bacterium]|nr:ParB/RepB/Spo0J family partition protein [Vicinamibacterales bacterium]